MFPKISKLILPDEWYPGPPPSNRYSTDKYLALDEMSVK